MLVLTRRLGQVLRIGRGIKVTVLEVSQGRVRIGIDAPRDIDIHREEAKVKVKKNKKRDFDDMFTE